MKTSGDIPRSNAAPRFSSNELAKYLFETPAGRLRKIKEQKFGDQKRSYYTRALNGILASFLPNTGSFEPDILRRLEAKIRKLPADKKSKVDRLTNNAEMLKRFCGLCAKLEPMGGHNEVIRRGAFFLLGDVQVSVRPEIMTTRSEGKAVSLTKLHFSKDGMSADVADVALLILLRYGGQLPSKSGELDVNHSCLIDCYGSRIVYGHEIPAIRERQLDEAVAQIARLWPMVQPASKPSDFFGN